MELSPIQLMSRSIPEKKKLNKMEQAIKDFKDERLTGLTDEEIEAIEKEIKSFLETKPEERKITESQLAERIKSLLKQYGFKGDIDAYSKQLFNEVTSQLKNSSAQSLPSSEAYIAYQKENAYIPSQKNDILYITE